MGYVCYIRAMKTLKKTLLILVSAFVITAIGCKKDEKDDKQDTTPNCIKLKSPSGTAEAIKDLEFKWEDCGQGPYELNLLLDDVLVLDTVVFATNFVHGQKLLMSRGNYKWYIKKGEFISDTIPFKAQPTDTFFAGSYRLKKYHYYGTSGMPQSYYQGEVMINIESQTPDEILAKDSLNEPIFFANFSIPQYKEGWASPMLIGYGYPSNKTASYNVLTDTIVLRTGSGSSYYVWRGKKH